MFALLKTFKRYWNKGVRRKKRRISYSSMSYRDYLQTPYWKWLSRRIRQRDDYTCQKCGQRGWIVHHNFYPKRGTEHQYHDCLITVCEACHKKIHNKH